MRRATVVLVDCSMPSSRSATWSGSGTGSGASVPLVTAGAGVSQPVVSRHLAMLKQAGLVRDRHEGRQTHYSALPGALAPLTDWTNEMTGFWESRFDDLENLLGRMDQ